MSLFKDDEPSLFDQLMMAALIIFMITLVTCRG